MIKIDAASKTEDSALISGSAPTLMQELSYVLEAYIEAGVFEQYAITTIYDLIEYIDVINISFKHQTGKPHKLENFLNPANNNPKSQKMINKLKQELLSRGTTISDAVANEIRDKEGLGLTGAKKFTGDK